MLGRIKQTDLSVPTHASRLSVLFAHGGRQTVSHPMPPQRARMEAPEEVLLDLNELGKDKKFVGLGISS